MELITGHSDIDDRVGCFDSKLGGNAENFVPNALTGALGTFLV